MANLSLLGACPAVAPRALEIFIGLFPLAANEPLPREGGGGGCPGVMKTDFMAEYTSSAVERTISLPW